MISDNLRALVSEKLAKVSGFSCLSSGCFGAYPSAIIGVLTELAGNGSDAADRASALLIDAARQSIDRPFADPDLPLPHPLDHEWRFTHVSAELLLRNATRALKADDTLLLVCTPTVLRVATLQKREFKIVYAARLDDPVTIALKRLTKDVKFVDVRCDLRGVNAQAAIVDPPWYDDIAIPMLQKAMRGTTLSGYIYFCVPDVLTACSSAEVLSNRRLVSSVLGASASELPIRMRYETPLFEVNALLAAGVQNFHPQWRTSRVFLLSQSKSGTPDVNIPQSTGWREIAVGRSRVRVRERKPREASHWFVGECSIVPSVSKAAYKIANTTFVSSGNRVGQLGGTGVCSYSDDNSFRALGSHEEIESTIRLTSKSVAYRNSSNPRPQLVQNQ